MLILVVFSRVVLALMEQFRKAQVHALRYELWVGVLFIVCV